MPIRIVEIITQLCRVLVTEAQVRMLQTDRDFAGTLMPRVREARTGSGPSLNNDTDITCFARCFTRSLRVLFAAAGAGPTLQFDERLTFKSLRDAGTMLGQNLMQPEMPLAVSNQGLNLIQLIEAMEPLERERALSFAMARHMRLGIHSPAHQIPWEIMQTILLNMAAQESWAWFLFH